MRRLGKANTFSCLALLLCGVAGRAQMIDNTQATSTSNAGINKSLADEIGAGRGNLLTPGSSIYIITRDPYRSIRRGRQLFQRKFTQAQGQPRILLVLRRPHWCSVSHSSECCMVARSRLFDAPPHDHSLCHQQLKPRRTDSNVNLANHQGQLIHIQTP
jgi:hypothetical protein